MGVLSQDLNSMASERVSKFAFGQTFKRSRLQTQPLAARCFLTQTSPDKALLT